jgi:hypothetical protein
MFGRGIFFEIVILINWNTYSLTKMNTYSSKRIREIGIPMGIN